MAVVKKNNVLRYAPKKQSTQSPIFIITGSLCTIQTEKSIDKWINGIHNADFVVTDSFHGTVFSLIFRKQFAVMGNPNRGLTRIYSLLKLFGLEDRFVNQESQIGELLQNEIDYEIIKSKIDIYKKNSMDFLHHSLV